jgi:hypothetical protein
VVWGDDEIAGIDKIQGVAVGMVEVRRAAN